MGVKLGLNAKLYYCLAVISSPEAIWVLVEAAREVSVPVASGEADVSTRGGAGWKATAGTLKDASVDFDLVYDLADPACMALLHAFLTGATINLAAADGVLDANGTHYFMAPCQLVKFERKEALEDAVVVAVTAKPTPSDYAPFFGETRSHAPPPPIP